MAKLRISKRRPFSRKHHFDLLYGPRTDSPREEAELQVLWTEGGGREAFHLEQPYLGAHRHYEGQSPGRRPWAWWACDVTEEMKRIYQDAGARCEAEALIALGLCDEAEQQAIIDEDIINRQLKRERMAKERVAMAPINEALETRHRVLGQRFFDFRSSDED